MTGVTAQPVPANLMRVHGGIEPLPQIDILDRLFVGRVPAVLFLTAQWPFLSPENADQLRTNDLEVRLFRDTLGCD